MFTLKNQVEKWFTDWMIKSMTLIEIQEILSFPYTHFDNLLPFLKIIESQQVWRAREKKETTLKKVMNIKKKNCTSVVRII